MSKNRRLNFSYLYWAVLFGGILLTAQNSAQGLSGPHAVIDSSSWNYGYLPQKAEVSHRFFVHNTGSAPLTVSKITADCSCTSVSKIKRPIVPGDSAAILVTFKTGRCNGLVKKTAKVYTDDPETPVQNLKFMGNIIKEGELTGNVGITPHKLSWKSKNGKLTADVDTLRILNKGVDDISVAVLHFPEEIVTKTDNPRKIGPKEVVSLILHISKEPIPAESGAFSATLSFTGRDTTVITEPIEIEK